MANKGVPNSEQNQFKSGAIAVENGRKGGIASGKAKAAKRTWRQIAEELGKMKITNSKQLQSVKEFFGELTGDATHDDAVIAKAYIEAANGNIQASRFIADIKGEIIEKHEVEQKITDYTLEEKRKQIKSLIEQLKDE